MKVPLLFWAILTGQAEARVRGATESYNISIKPRKLTDGPLQLTGYGGEPEDEYFPLGRCEGDCDFDSHCAGDMVCYQRDKFEPAPGCVGGRDFAADTDFCAPAQPGFAIPAQPTTAEPTDTYAPTFEPTYTPTVTIVSPAIEDTEPSAQPSTLAMNPLTPLEFITDDVVAGLPLGLCQGDCDTDDDCLDEYICFQREMFEEVPGCAGRGEASIDYCTKEFTGTVVIVITGVPLPLIPPTEAPVVGGPTLPELTTVGDNLGLPLGMCEGDCDTDDDCLDELVCFQRDLLDPVPGCSGLGHISYDYCIMGPPTTAPAPVPAPTIPVPIETPVPVVPEAITQAPSTAEPVLEIDPLLPPLSFVATVVQVGQPLGLCEGDCDTDDDCLDNLICYERDGFEPVPGCSGTGEVDIDYCTIGFTGGAMVSLAPVSAVTRPPQLQGVQLPNLENVGDNLPLPLGLCQGDCDTDDDCLDDLVCFQRDLLDPVPGCLGEGQISWDYCIVAIDATIAPTSPPVARPTMPPAMPTVPLPELETVGDDLDLPIGICQGDCDTDADCLDELVCFQRNYLEEVPGCSGTGDATYDYCVESGEGTMAPTWAPFDFPVNPPSNEVGFPELEEVTDNVDLPIGLCQGDCDTDADCLDELICYQRYFSEPVPGCSGSGKRSYDYCIVDPFATPSPTGAVTRAPIVVPTTSPAESSSTVVFVLVVVGDGSELPLGLCEGDCDTDDDCLDDLVCFERDLNEPVPGCEGPGRTSFDYCIRDPFATPTPTLAPVVEVSLPPASVALLPELVEVSDGGDLPLGLCEGDCDTDDDCLDELICFQRDYLEPVRGCRGEGRKSYDYCIRSPFGTPAPTFTPVVVVVLPPSTATVPLPELVEVSDEGTLPLGLCEGDCDTDADCLDLLICFQRNRLEKVPGCAGTGRISYDYCIENPNPATPVLDTPLPTTAMPTNPPTTPVPETALPVTPMPTNPPTTPLPTTALPATPLPTTALPATPMPTNPPTTPMPTNPPLTTTPATAQPVTAQPVTAPPVTAQPVTATPQTSPPVTVVVVIEAEEVPQPPTTAPVLVISSVEEQLIPLSWAETQKSHKSKSDSDSYEGGAQVSLGLSVDNGMGRCEGECSANEDCAEGLICFAPTENFVPGCIGDPEGYWFCIPNPWGTGPGVRGRKRHRRHRKH